ncbi:unnamed protein product [Amoebophrya sp. A25]|nr:unnamed protein product [Amoebophrya sp. A25]|eukprot:GSA25T00008181001.1
MNKMATANGAAPGAANGNGHSGSNGIELPPLWEPVFPPAHKLIPLVEVKGTPALRANMSPYEKKTLSPQSRSVDGWRKANAEASARQKLISDVLSRWWFVFPIWPPPNFDYAKVLRREGYREVQISEWNKAPEEVEEAPGGRKLAKVYQLGNFPGVFRNSRDELLDMRPKDSCPCFANLQKQPWQRLCEFAVRAYENQIDVLKQVGGYKHKEQIATLMKEMTRYREQLRKGSSAALHLTADAQRKVRKM